MTNKIKFSQRQLDKIADQLRILSWAQGAIATQLHFDWSYAIIFSIVCIWITLQSIACFLERDKNV